METLTFKKFISVSKYVVNFNKMNFIGRLIFYMEAPRKYKKFKKVYKEEMQGKIIKKEV